MNKSDIFTRLFTLSSVNIRWAKLDCIIPKNTIIQIEYYSIEDNGLLILNGVTAAYDFPIALVTFLETEE